MKTPEEWAREARNTPYHWKCDDSCPQHATPSAVYTDHRVKAWAKVFQDAITQARRAAFLEAARAAELVDERHSALISTGDPLIHGEQALGAREAWLAILALKEGK